MGAGKIVVVVAAIAASAAAGALLVPEQSTSKTDEFIADIGGPFTLTDTSGATVTYDDLKGRPHAVFFGYTFCPDVCPTTLFEMSNYLVGLGDQAEDLGVYFISVDPKNDTAERLDMYISAFDPRIVGLTGPREAIDEAVREYRIYYKVHPEDENGFQLIDHSAHVLLFDENAHFRGQIAYGEDPKVALAKLENLVNGT
ncbi:MAG: SCO family protein [Pseudomonadota bacterium]